MDSWIDRLINEKRELADKIEKLSQFIFSNKSFTELTQFEQLLLEVQLQAMRRYLHYLERRIAFYVKG